MHIIHNHIVSQIRLPGDQHFYFLVGFVFREYLIQVLIDLRRSDNPVGRFVQISIHQIGFPFYHRIALLPERHQQVLPQSPIQKSPDRTKSYHFQECKFADHYMGMFRRCNNPVLRIEINKSLHFIVRETIGRDIFFRHEDLTAFSPIQINSKIDDFNYRQSIKSSYFNHG